MPNYKGPARLRAELDEFGPLLQSGATLSEAKQILLCFPALAQSSCSYIDGLVPVVMGCSTRPSADFSYAARAQQWAFLPRILKLPQDALSGRGGPESHR